MTKSIIHSQPNIPIKYEDEHLLIIEKPINMLSQPNHSGDADIVTACTEYMASQNRRPPGLIHRLDRPVGGLMMLAKTKRADKKLHQMLRDHEVMKVYLAVVHGNTPSSGNWVHHLRKHKEINQVEILPKKRKRSKRAELSFITLAQNRTLSLVQISLQTGRTHQIRAQFSAEGHPIVGDQRYGIENEDESLNMALRAYRLRLSHPVTGEELDFTSLPDTDSKPFNTFKEHLNKL